MSVRPKHVLVVEDDVPTLETLSELLEGEGYRVSTASNGDEALARLRSGLDGAPDAILLDLRMPVMDGWSFRTALRRDSHLGAIPVIAMSADGSAQAEAISADAFLRKPLSAPELLSTVSRIVAEGQRRRRSSHRDEVERLASLGRVTAGVGHEINNPLAYAMLNVTLASDRLKELARSKGTGGPAQPLDAEAGELAELLAAAMIGLERIRGVVRGLQSLSRKTDGEREPVDLEKVIDESLAVARNQIRHRARLSKRYGHVPPVMGSAGALGQVFLNLLINAAHALPERDASNNVISVTTRCDGAHVVVEIADTGHGIAADVLPHIFDPFFTTKSAHEGTGLGLAICHRIVNDHGGTLAIESEVGRGTVCRLSLRAVTPNQVEAARTTEPADPADAPRSDARARILVIDDEVMIRDVVGHILSKRHDVTLCGGAEAAFALLNSGQTFDLILCDVLMPDLGGEQVFEAVGARWPALLPRLVFMTGGAPAPEGDTFLGRLRNRILYKPFAPAELDQVVDAIVNQ